MASLAQLAIAKATLTAVLLRPDPEPCSRDDVDEFTRLLALAAARCSPANVQTCKQWIIRHISASPARSAATGRYLAALASSFSHTPAAAVVTTATTTPTTSARRRRLHLLYIINDVLYHVTYRSCDAPEQHFTASIEPSLVPLVTAAASFARAPKQIAKIRSLLDLWSANAYYPDAVLAQLRAAVEAGIANKTAPQAAVKAAKSTTTKTATPFLMPALHGDPATPWYDLPAANWLALLEPNSTRPMNPAALRPLEMPPGPAPPALVACVRDVLADVDRIFGLGNGDSGGDSDGDSDIDALGARVEIDPLHGDVVDGDSYYGWSRAFCRRMKERGVRHGYGADDSRSLSPVSPRPAYKKRRVSDAGRSRSQSRSRSRSYSSDDRQRDAPLGVPGHDHRGGRRRSRHSPGGPKTTTTPAALPPYAQAIPPPIPGAFPFVPVPVPVPPPPPPRPQGYQGPWPPPLPPPPPHLFPQSLQQHWPPPGPNTSTSTGDWAGGWAQNMAHPQHQPHDNRSRGGRGAWSSGSRW